MKVLHGVYTVNHESNQTTLSVVYDYTAASGCMEYIRGKNPRTRDPSLIGPG